MTFLNRHRSRIRPPGPFSPSSLFFSGIPGAWYDPTDLSTLFQDSAGTTPVTAVEQPVGLILDKSQGLARGPEVVTNGTFATNVTGWTAQAGDTLSWDSGNGGRLKIDDTNNFGAGIAYQIINTVAGTTYAVTFTSSLGTSVQTRIYVGTAIGNASMGFRVDNANATNGTLYFVASGATAYLQFVCQTTGAFSYLDDISVVSVAGNHASQSTAASRPTYRARYNLLTQSEDFSQAVWTKQNTTITTNAAVAPDGTTTADTLVETAANAVHVSYQIITATIGARYTFSCYAKAAQRSYVALQMYNTVSNARFTALFDLVGGSVVTTRTSNAPTGTSSSITDAGNGWWRIQITMDQVGGTQNYPQIALSDSATPTFASDLPTYLGDGTSGAYIWGAQLLTANDATATGNAYQRIAAATVYDTAPIFRPYLAFDGLDDSLSTAAINFTSTDKMTVFAGVTKSSDAATAIFLELTAVTTANAFYITAPTDPTTVKYRFASVGTGPIREADVTASTFVAPNTSVLTGVSNISAPIVALRMNGTQISSVATSQGTGNYSNAPLFIGRRNNTSFPFNGRIYELIVRGAASSTTEIAETELWVNARTGAY